MPLLLCDGYKLVATTHQSIANDLVSSRQVIIRLLKEFKRQQLVKLQPGSLMALDQD